MKKYISFVIFMAAMLLLMTVFEPYAHARAGGGRSFGSRGTRSYSQPASPYSQPSRQQAAPAPSPYQQPAQGGLFGGMGRSMLGGIAGGMLGGMLFRSLGFGGAGGAGGGGIGMFEILLLAGIGYLIYRFIKNKRESQSSAGQGGYQSQPSQASISQFEKPEQGDAAAGLAHIRQMDPTFDESRFKDSVMDIFFKIQGAWMNRDLTPVAPILADEMRRIMQGDVDTLLRDKQVNRLENIAVRSVEIAEVWQEAGQDFITTLIYANLLDYTTDDATGQVVSGSKTDPVKFEEFWTFTRPVGSNPWRLSGIDQK